MPSELIKKYLEELKSQNKFDQCFIDILAEANETDESGDATAERILLLVKQRYAENKKDKT